MDTPETDELYERLLKENPGNLIYLEEMLELARKLERERDEARTERDILEIVDPAWPVFIRQMERERDEARNQRDILRLDAQREAEHHDRMVGELEKVYAERDEAREERDSLQVMRKEVVAANKGAKINAHVSNSLAGKLNRAERERDEARAELAEWTDSAKNVRKEFEDEHHCSCVPILRKLLKDAERERDEAREEIQRLRLALKTHDL
jgi:hypothetical protein